MISHGVVSKLLFIMGIFPAGGRGYGNVQKEE